MPIRKVLNEKEFLPPQILMGTTKLKTTQWGYLQMKGSSAIPSLLHSTMKIDLCIEHRHLHPNRVRPCDTFHTTRKNFNGGT